jgi:hypothetical protein
MSARDLERTFATVNCRFAKSSIDHLVGGGEQFVRNGEAKSFRGLMVDDHVRI